MDVKDILKAGVSVKDITPEIGCHLMGYSPDIISKSVNDPLNVTALALSYGDVSVIFISVAVGAINSKLSDEIRSAVSEKTGVPVSNVLLSAIHTHSGPNTCGMVGWGGVDREYCDGILFPRTILAAFEACQALRPAKVGVSSVWSKAGINRRQHNADGSVTLGQNPHGPYDGNMTVVSFKGDNGKTIASLFHYGAHGTCAGANTEISRDWAGIVIDRLAKVTGAPVAYFNGALGDVGPRLSNGSTIGDISYIYETGGIAAVDATRAFRQIKTYRSERLKVVTGNLSLSVNERIPLETAREEYKKYEGERINTSGLNAKYYADVIASYEQNLPAPKAMMLRQTLVSIGDIAFVPFPFEIFSEISLRLRDISPFTHTLCLGLTNGTEGYLPTQSQLCLGGYEILSFKIIRVWPLADNTDDNIIRENLKLMEGLKCTE